MVTSQSINAFRLRKATQDDIPQLSLLIEASVRALHTEHYTPEQISGALKSIYGVDTTLIYDRNYFVVETSAPPSLTEPAPTSPAAVAVQIVGCGGWSYRRTLYGGDRHNARDDNVLDPAKDAGKIRAFFVHPEWTRKGVGGIVLRACENAARAAGFKTVEMGATLSGVPFHASSGYSELERVEERLENGIVVNFARMGKVLE